MRSYALLLAVLCGCPSATAPTSSDATAAGPAASPSLGAAGTEDCPPLRVTIDGQPVEFPLAYASVGGDPQQLELSILSGDIVSCNGIRLPARARNVGLMPFREAYSTDASWEPPESGQEEEVTLSYFVRQHLFGELDWRGGGHSYQLSDADADPVMLSDSLDGEVVEVCIPRRKIENKAWRGKDDPRANRSTLVIEGRVRATMCGPRMTADDWHAGELGCDSIRSQEGDSRVDVDIFVDPDVEYGVIGFLSSDEVNCDDLTTRRPLFAAHVSYEFSESPGLGSAETNAANAGAIVSTSYYGNSVSPVGPAAGGAVCLHRPLYWYREGRVGFVRGELTPKRCPPT